MRRKKKMMGLFVIIGILFFIVGCEENKVTTNEITNYIYGQNVICLIEEFDGQYEYFGIEGMLISSPLPEFNYLSINNQVFNSIYDYDIHPGYGSFYLTTSQINTIELEDTVNFEFDTEYGTVSGSQNRPPQINNVKVNDNFPETGIQIIINEELEVSWDYSDIKPDFIRIYGEYHFNGNNRVTYWFEHFIPNTQDSIQLFSENEINNEGNIALEIELFNGPNPDSNEDGNLNGDGVGCLYWAYGKDEYNLDIEVANSERTIFHSKSRKTELLKFKRNFLDIFKSVK